MAAMILSSAIMLTSERVIRTPELLQAIFVFVGLAPAARLARTSRYFFHTIAPILWRDIDGVEVLFALLPGTTIDHTKNEEMWMRVIVGDRLLWRPSRALNRFTCSDSPDRSATQISRDSTSTRPSCAR